MIYGITRGKVLIGKPLARSMVLHSLTGSRKVCKLECNVWIRDQSSWASVKLFIRKHSFTFNASQWGYFSLILFLGGQVWLGWRKRMRRWCGQYDSPNGLLVMQNIVKMSIRLKEQKSLSDLIWRNARDCTKKKSRPKLQKRRNIFVDDSSTNTKYFPWFFLREHYGINEHKNRNEQIVIKF